MENEKKIALLIDADNVSQKYIKYILDELATYGISTYKRIYGDWTQPNLSSWKEQLLECSITPVQQYSYTKGKNSTDSALIIDAMDILYSKNVDGFCIVSSDSDYTPLAIKLHESGVYVMGVGEKKTPVSFRNACDEFLFLENISAAVETPQAGAAAAPAEEKPAKTESAGAADKADAAASKQPAEGKPASESKPAEDTAARADADETDSIEEIHALLRKAYDTYQDEDGYVYVATAGHFLKRTKPDFDCRTYGYTKLSQLLRAFPKKYELKRYGGKGAAANVAYKCPEKNI